VSTGRRSGSHSYARWEFERRFLVDRVPAGLVEANAWDVVDRYLRDSRLRLRRMTPVAGGEPVFKLGKKEVPDPPDYSRMTITTIHLSAAEYDLLAPLPGHELRKRRHRVDACGREFGVDVFEGALSGLVLAETEFHTEEGLRQEIELPEWAACEVSTDERLTGGALAALSDHAAAALVLDPTAER
jgi:hypothetical protein